MTNDAFFLFVAAVVFVFGLFESFRTSSNTKNLFAIGFFLFVLQFVIVPYSIDFVSWFIGVGTSAGMPQATYLQGLFIGSMFIAIYYFFKSYTYYLKKTNPPDSDKQ